MSFLVSTTSSTAQFLDRQTDKTHHLNWKSIRRFMYLVHTYNSSGLHFDIFSRIVFHVISVWVYEYFLYEFTFGISYMYMMTFIKQYTKKFYLETTLNPFLKAINIAIIIQTIVWMSMNANSLTDSLMFFALSMRSVPNWSLCPKNGRGCISSKDIVLRCYANQSTKMENSSAHLTYMRTMDKDLSINNVSLIFVWTLTFMIASVSDGTLVKFFKLSFVLRAILTLSTFCILSLTSISTSILAFKQLFSVKPISNDDHKYSPFQAIARVVYSSGIGLVGVYDVGLSPHLMVDNALIIITAICIAFAFLRSIIVRTLYLEHLKCIEMDSVEILEIRYLLFAVLPLSTEFQYAQRLYLYYIYGTLTISLTSYLLILTLSVAKLINSECPSVNNVYMVGIVCLLLLIISSADNRNTFIWSLDMHCLLSLMLGALKSGVIAYIYGLDRFSTDIHYWLGFKPTKFWTIQWLLLPIILLLINMVLLTWLIEKVKSDALLTWVRLCPVSFLILFVYKFLTFKTILTYLMKNNIMGLFRASKKYGPLDPEDRRNRRNFDEVLSRRKCTHACIVIDERYDCNHLPLMSNQPNSGDSSQSTSLTNIYQERTTSHRVASHETVQYY